MVLSQCLTIVVRGDDPRGHALLADAHAMGYQSLHSVTISDLIFFRGSIGSGLRDDLVALLVDPLLQTSTWSRNCGVEGETDLMVETVLLPGVTDAVAEQLLRVARGKRWPLHDVVTGRRIELRGEIPQGLRETLIRRLMVNPVIEHWVIDSLVEPTFAQGVAVAVDGDDESSVTGNSFASGMRASQAPDRLPRLQYAAHPGRPDQAVRLLGCTETDLEALNIARGMALDPAELEAVRAYYAVRGGVAPDIELEMIAQTWSEHCAHKTFRARITTSTGEEVVPLLEQLRRATARIDAPYVVSAFVGNAGVLQFTPGTTFAVKCETHNHPSAIEPFGGANTGVGGVIRDVLGASHRPIACTDILCFGPADTADALLPDGVIHPRRVRSGVVAGIADYGNKVGLPTLAGAVLYDPGYIANPLVFAGCVGMAKAPYVAERPLPGDRIVVLGGATGRDGIRGATFSSATMDATTGDVAGASVQIGDPITEKLLVDLLADGRHLYRAITDCGAGGLSSAIGEMAEGIGAEVDLDELPMKYHGLAPWEVWLSEAQERMVVATADPEPLFAACAILGIHCTDVGAFTGAGRLVVRSSGHRIVDIDTVFLHDGRPTRHMVAKLPQPNRIAAFSHVPPLLEGGLTSKTSSVGAKPLAITGDGLAITVAELEAILLELLAHPNIACKASVIRRYDHEIRGATLVRPLVGEPIGGHIIGHADGTVIAEPLAPHGIALGIGVNPWFGITDPERMGQSVVDEAVRNVVACGGDPDRTALLDNFSWGDPRRHETLGDLVATVAGACEAAIAFAAPFVSGKDSLNNEYLGADGGRHAVPPTLVITAVAHVPEASRTITPDLKFAGNALLVVGMTPVALGGTHIALVRDLAPSSAPPFDQSAPARYRRLHAAIRDGLVVSCHDISEGGLAVALCEMAIAGNLGFDTPAAPPTFRADASGSDRSASDVEVLFGEGNGRFVVEVDQRHVGAFIARLNGEASVIGAVSADRVARFPVLGADRMAIPVAALRQAWSGRP